MRGFFTPSKPRSGGRAVVEDTPMTGRRDLGGGGPLHLWNIQNTPGTPGQDTATDSEMHGVRTLDHNVFAFQTSKTDRYILALVMLCSC